MDVLAIVVGVLIAAGIALFITIIRLVQVCQPNEVLIFSGSRRRIGNKSVGYRIVKGDRGIRKPMIERVDRMDLTNMIIDVSAVNAYSKGGVPLTVQGVANVKVAGHEPVLNNAIERFLGKSREEIISIAKATLEGSLRGVLSTLTPEQVNDDKLLFAERLVHEVEHDMTSLGLVVDTLKIQNVQDDVKYLDSIGRKQTAEVVRVAKIAEAKATAEAAIRAAENRQREVTAQINAQVSVVKADAQKRLTDALTKRDAVVAEGQDHDLVTATVLEGQPAERTVLHRQIHRTIAAAYLNGRAPAVVLMAEPPGELAPLRRVDGDHHGLPSSRLRSNVWRGGEPGEDACHSCACVNATAMAASRS